MDGHDQPPRSPRDDAVKKVATIWSDADPEVAPQWASKDPDVAGQRLRELPASPSRDAALAAYVDVLSVENPAWVARWLATLPPTEQNHGLIEKVAKQWFEFNCVAAEAWLRQTPLPDERKRTLLASLP